MKPHAIMKPRTIALDVSGISFVESYLVNVALGVIRYARRHTSWRMLYNERNLSLRNSFVDFSDLEELGADGIIFSYYSHWSDAKLARIRALGIPMVAVSNDFPQRQLPFARVVTDDREIGRMVAADFLERGFEQFAYYGDPALPWECERRAGFVEGLEAAGRACREMPGARSRNRRVEARRLEQWLAGLPRPIAVMAATDTRALHIIEACHALGIEVPHELALIGVDNNPVVCEAQLPSISSVEQDTGRVGYEAAALLDRMLDEGRQRFDQIVVPPRGVVTRMSSDVLAVDDAALSRALGFIRERAAEPIAIDAIVQAAAVSRSSLERRFKARLGATINETLRRRRFEIAKSLLRDRDRSLDEVAAASGFRRATYLCQVFREELKMTPREWRLRFSAGGDAPN